MDHTFPLLREARLKNSETSKQPSKITIPERAHPFAKLVFKEMRRQSISYEELEWRAGVLKSTFKAWRSDNRPGAETIEAALGALGWTLVPVPKLDRISPELRARIADIAADLQSEEAAVGAVLTALAEWPEYARVKLHRPQPEGLAA